LEAARDPRAAEAAAGGPASSGRAVSIALGLEALVADDKAINREVAVAMLEERGCKVVVAEDGNAAVRLALARRLDVILMDCQMPGMDGYQATMAIRREEQLLGKPAIPIVALTANVLARDRDRCTAAGMTSFLSKPFTPAQLIEVLRPIAEQRGTLKTVVAVAEAPARAVAQTPPRPERHADPPVLSEASVVDMLEVPLFAPAPEEVERPTAQQVAVLDHEQVEAILSLGKPSVFEELCRLLAESAPAALATIEKALAAGDLVTVADTAHSLKSSCANLGGRQMASQLDRCELAARDGRDLDGILRETSGLQRSYAALSSALAQVIARRARTA
jgi:CheY-like chemotaxis protein